MRRLRPFVLALLAAGPLAAQSSQFGVRGLGLPLRPLSVRATATGGSFGMFDPESGLNPASIGLVLSVTANFQTVQNWRRSVSPTGTFSGRDNRYPGIFIAGPIGGSRLTTAVSMSGYTDRNFELASRDTLILRGQPVETFDSLTSHGGLSDLRVAVAWRQSTAVQWGMALHVLSGSNRLESRRYFSDSAYSGARERATVSYLGFGVSGGVVARLNRKVSLSGMLRFDDKVTVERDSFNLGKTDLPLTVAGGIRVQLSERLMVAGGGLYRNWSVADANLVAQGGVGSNNITEFNFGAEYVPDPRHASRRPIRLGFHRARLPFPLQRGVDVNETGVSLGTSFRFVNDRAGLDMALERIWRKGGPSFSETATLLTVGFTIHPVKLVYIETYGCQMNVADTELMRGVLGRAGYGHTEQPEGADVLLVNTCAVRDNAEQRVIGRVGELQRHKRAGTVLGVVGCMAQRLGPALLERVPKVDLVVGPDGYRNLPELIAHATAGERHADTEFRGWEHYEDVPPVRVPGPTQFVTVQRGCDYRCTFCIVPYTRGPERSRTLGDVVREVAALAEIGTTEVTLLGQTVNSWSDGRYDFADLLRATGAVEGIRRVRFTSPYPTDFTERVITAMSETAAVCEHVHLPVQSGSNAVLRRMLRRYTREDYLEVVDRLRSAIPGITISTDIIVGFPGETEDQFEETVALVREAGFDDAYTFRYSMREGTPGAKLKDQVPEEVSAARLARLIEVVRDQARTRNMGRVGMTQEALVERPARRGDMMLARTRTNHLVLVDRTPASIGEYHSVRLTGTTGSTFTGEIVSPQLAVLS